VRAINTRYGNAFYRSRTEAKWAVFFDACGIPYDYEYRGYHLEAGRYLPDFWLPSFQMFFEVKGAEPDEEERQKCADLAASMDRVVLMAQGAPEERFQIRWFDGSGEDDRLYVIARDRNADAGFWLVSDDELVGGERHSRWFGGGNPGVTMRRGPMLSGAIEQAYALAQMIRFEHGAGARNHRVSVIPENDPMRREPAA
jgi:hypothetical protein